MRASHVLDLHVVPVLARSRRAMFSELKTNRPICCRAGWLNPEKSTEFS
eukprot:COSAG01_NODE_70909_length_257_cov_0.968354_1_plen_48_part_01